jgi:2-haloacid dehalogenase
MKIGGIRACVFDAYGTLFDVNSAARNCQESLGTKWQPLAELWRSKQLQYTWLRSLAGHHADFWQVTGDALDFALETLQINEGSLRKRLMDFYLAPCLYSEVAATLKRLNVKGMTVAILSNGSPSMLHAAVANAGIAELIGSLMSVEEVKVYKPDPAVYEMVGERLNVARNEVCFVSSNGWDAYSAKAFGFRVVWCNRLGWKAERIPSAPDVVVPTLEDLPDIVAT